MSLYGDKFKIGGLSCGLVLRGRGQRGVPGGIRAGVRLPGEDRGPELGPLPPSRGSVSCPRATVSPSRISSTAPLPAAIMWCCRWEPSTWVTFTGYQAQVTELQGTIQEQAGTIQTQQNTIAEKDSTIAQQEETIQTQTATIDSQAAAIEELEAAGTAETVKADLQAAYEEGVESNG